MNTPKPRTVIDLTTGRPILLAPHRQKRPMHTGDNKTDKRCPFCGGNEDDTPQVIDVEPKAGTATDTDGWRVRAFANLYPATAHHEVIAEGPKHNEHPCDLDAATWRDAVMVWRRRIMAMEGLPDVACAFLFKNVGARAGASIAHNHSQIIGLEILPPRLELERAQQRLHGKCLICANLEDATQRIIVDTKGYVALAPATPKLPFETWLLPRNCHADFFTADPTALGHALHLWLKAVAHGLDRPACNLWLHRVPVPLLNKGEHFHWHFELQPRTGQLAGLELGADMYINSVPAEVTAARLREGKTQ